MFIPQNDNLVQYNLVCLEESGGYKRKPGCYFSLQLITSQSPLLMVLSLLHCRSLSSGAATLSVSLLLFTLLPPKLLTLLCCCSFTVTLHCCYSLPAQAAHSPLLLFIWCCSFTVFTTAATLLPPKLLTLLLLVHCHSSLLLLSTCPSCSLTSAAVHLVLLVGR